MILNPFETDGVWLKGNLHAHTTLSDGSEDVQARVRRYAEAGYDFLAITDHGKVAPLPEAPEILLIRGIELGAPNAFGGSGYHIVGLDVPEGFQAGGGANERIAAIRASGGEALVGHPYWCGHSLLDLMVLHGYLAIEVYNSTCERIGKGTSSVHWDDLLDRVGPVLAVAVDDCHRDDVDVLDGWVMVKARERSKDAVMDALRAGAFYSSRGPALESVGMKGGKVFVECPGAAEVRFICQRSTGGRIVLDGASRAEYALKGTEKYVRVELADASGKKAWTNPFWLEGG